MKQQSYVCKTAQFLVWFVSAFLFSFCFQFQTFKFCFFRFNIISFLFWLNKYWIILDYLEMEGLIGRFPPCLFILNMSMGEIPRVGLDMDDRLFKVAAPSWDEFNWFPVRLFLLIEMMPLHLQEVNTHNYQLISRIIMIKLRQRCPPSFEKVCFCSLFYFDDLAFI